jgi:hypothetical protein
LAGHLDWGSGWFCEPRPECAGGDMGSHHIGADRQLFCNGSLLDRLDGVELALHPPEKTYEKLLIADRPWESFVLDAWCTVLSDQGRYRMWYECLSKQEPGGKLCYAESDDGLHWRKPELGLISFGGSSANNIVFPPPKHNYHGGTVFKDPNAKPAERYKMVYMGLNPVGVYGATSPDGLHWTVSDGVPLLRTQSDTQSVGFWDPRIEKYVAFVRLNAPRRIPDRLRTIGRSESADFRNWPAAEIAVSFDDNDPPDTDLYNSAAFKYAHAENAYFILTSLFHQKSDTVDVQLAWSNDGIRWNRSIRRPFIALGEEGSFDSKTIYASVGQVRHGNELWVYYHGSDVGHDEWHPSVMSYGGTLTRAVSRVDGFLSLGADGAEGSVMTQPLEFSGSRLVLNFQTEPDGKIEIELCDQNGQPIEGFERTACEPMRGDSTAGVVRWRRQSDLSRFAGRPVRLACHLDRSHIFAFQFSK